MIEVTFLGTGTSQGVPMIGCDCRVCRSSDPRDNRLRTSALVQTQGRNIVIDAGPDFRTQILRAKITHLDAILLTHAHKDHIGGLDDIRAFNYFQQSPIDVYAEKITQKTLLKDFDYAFAEVKYPGVPEISLHTIEEDHAFEVGGVSITPIRGLHYKLPVLGFKIGAFCYLTDMNHLSSREIDKIKGVDTLVVNALRREPHISHFSLPEALDLIKEISPREAYLTHLSHQMGLYTEVSQELPSGVHLAYDTLHLQIPDNNL